MSNSCWFLTIRHDPFYIGRIRMDRRVTRGNPAPVRIVENGEKPGATATPMTVLQKADLRRLAGVISRPRRTKAGDRDGSRSR